MRKGKRVVVTDGVSANGDKLVRGFASYGASTAFFYSHSYDKALVLSREASALNIRCKIAKLDSLWSAREVLRGYFDDEFDTLVCNIDLANDTDFDDMSGEKWRREVIAEIDGLFYIIRALRPFMNRNGGSIIIAAAKDENSGFASKIMESYIEGLTRSLSESMRSVGIHVNAIIYRNSDYAGSHVFEAVRQLASSDSSFITGQIIRL
ncbi:SDR family oxidoreductase [Mogibacterium timidum]|uniref:SDR family oxidoreductase n=1 Tax=Mogibacterium timidum TaxID=35519 RepID=UPI0028E646E1|nr:SDR family oxidoreductase [Mogibacterium timidum]